LRDHSYFKLTSFDAMEMPELTSTEVISEELIASDAGTQDAENPTPTSWETSSAPSLPSIDSQRNTVRFRAMWVVCADAGT
jgi:hypothetical protein